MESGGWENKRKGGKMVGEIMATYIPEMELVFDE